MRTVAFSRLGDPEFDPESPAAYPIETEANLMGEMPVRLRAEGKNLVAYGFGGQRVVIPAASIRQVWIHPEFEGQGGIRYREALIILDARHRIVLRAPGAWGPGVLEVCRHLGLFKQPKIREALPASMDVPSLRRADNYQRLRVRPRSRLIARPAGGLGLTVLCLGGGVGGASLGLLLPASVGDARMLIAVGLGVTGALAGTWLYHFGTRFATGLVRWWAASRRAGSPAPAQRFLRVTGASPWTEMATSAVLAAAVPVLAIWGAVVEAITLSGGGTLSHGAALGNVIAGALALLATLPLARLAFRRILAARHRIRDDFTKDFG
jgi:hypothetical protein